MAIDSTYSDVYIRANSPGSTKYYMDIRPHPDPIMKSERQTDKISWECSYIAQATSNALWNIYHAFPHVIVSLDNGVNEYLCRWATGQAFERIYSKKVSLSCKFDFVILDQRSTSVTIYDDDGGNAVILDYIPFPFPEPVQAKDGTQRITIDSLYIDRTKANSLRGKYPSDIRIRLTVAGSTYYCRFDTLEIKQTSIDNLSLRLEATILHIVGGAAGSDIYIYDSAGANGVRLHANPFPFPFPHQARTVSSVKCLPGLSGATLTSGERIHFDGGVHVSDMIIEFDSAYISVADRTTLLTRYRLLADCQVSLDAGVTKYTCIFADYKENIIGDPSAGVHFKFLVKS